VACLRHRRGDAVQFRIISTRTPIEPMQPLVLSAGASAGVALFLTALGALIGKWEATSQETSDRESSLVAWERIVTVLQHPRCSNCHQPVELLQGDDGRRHTPRVVRGRDGQGIPGMRCGSCHNEQGNNEASRVPGAVEWKMPPRGRAWAAMSVSEMCRTLKDPTKNGRRSLKAIIKHLQEDPLTHWAWDPGGTRESIPMPHHVFVEFVEEWVRTGAHCPG
jgi:hypothetical protein